MAEYKAKLLNGPLIKAASIVLNNGSSVESAITPKIYGVEDNDPSAIVSWLNDNNNIIPYGFSIVDFKYAIGFAHKGTNNNGRIRFLSYYLSLDNKSAALSAGTWGNIN